MNLYYSLHRQCRIDQDGVPVIGAVLLRYKERPTWTIQLRDENNRPVDVSDVTGWRAAVDRDYKSGTAPMCRSLNEAIDSSAAASGSIAVSLDTNTVTFLAAVDGQDAAVAANFELWGFRDDLPVVYLVFPVSARAVVDAEGGAAPEEVQLRYDLDDIVRRLADLANYLPLTGGNITGGLTVGNNPVTALPVGTVAGTLYVGASREFTTIAAALDHIRQSSNGLDKVWNILLDPGEHTLSGTITGLNLSFAPVSGSYSTGCSIISDVTMEGCRATFTNLHFKAIAGADKALLFNNLSYAQASDCVFDCTANTNAYFNAFYLSGVSRGTLTRCTFYPGSVSTQSYARALALSYLAINGTSFIGTGVGIAVRAGGGSVVILSGTATTVSDMSRAALAENRSFILTSGGTLLTATNVTTYATPALNTVGNNQSFIN